MKSRRTKHGKSKKKLRSEWKDFLEIFFTENPLVISPQKKKILERYEKFVSDPSAKVMALFQNPFENIHDLDLVGRIFGEKVRSYAEILNRINDEDEDMIRNHDENEEMLILYLVNLENHFLDPDKKNYKKNSFKRRIPYAKKIIKVLSARELTEKLDDIFFSVMHPQSFARYATLFRSNWDTHRAIERKAKGRLQLHLEEARIRAEIHSRTKSISSLHEKVVKKNILPSQVMDIIGLRILVDSKKDCYRALETMLSQWNIQYGKIKDYIAIPKENGYQSIHVTGNYNSYQLEIQIRTFNMHHQAQYGKAAHHLYKANR